jgi:hypothetical protein
MPRPGLGYKRFPDLHPGRMRERLEVERDVDTREESFIEGFYAVGGEEEDASVIFNVSEAGYG